jgi:hypothetical protein
MIKKQTVTNLEIEKDIIEALKHPPGLSKQFNRRLKPPSLVIGTILGVMTFIYPLVVCWILLALLIISIGSIIFHVISIKYKIKRVSISDYDITTEVVHDIVHEQYWESGKGLVIYEKNNYNICFENGKNWRVPKRLYYWSDMLRSRDIGICRTIQHGSIMIVVTQKATGKIVVAYNTEFFEYKDR